MTDNFTFLALPTIAIEIFNAGPVETGILWALNYLAWAFLGLYAGVMIDRWKRKPVLIWTNIVQVLALASIPVTYFLNCLSLAQIFLVAIVMSMTSVFFAVAYQAYLPTLINREDLIEGNSKLESSASVASVVGQGIAGPLYQLLRAYSIALDALGTLIAAVMILWIREPEPPNSPEVTRRFWQELKAGVKVVSESPVLRSLTASTSILNFGVGMFWAVFFLFMYKSLLLPPDIAGYVICVGGIGTLIGAVSSPRLLKRLGLGPLLSIALVSYGVGLLAVQASVLGPSAIMLAGIWLLTSMSVPIYNVSQVSFRQTIVSDMLQGRMNATMRTVGYSGAALGAVVGGFVGRQFGISTAMMSGALIVLISALIIWLTPIGRVRETPITVSYGKAD
ncbi:MAG TPA: MFS transporter [Terriglobales bacterium]|nr:MFS transporter [Terriglobales bacterium]